MPEELSEKISSGIIHGLSDDLRGSKVIFITITFFSWKRKVGSTKTWFKYPQIGLSTILLKDAACQDDIQVNWHEKREEAMSKVTLANSESMVLESEAP